MIKFAQIYYLYGLVLVPVLILFYVLMLKRKKNAIKAFADISILNRLTNSFSKTRPGWKFTLVIVGFILIILALARPQIGSTIVKGEKKGVDLMILLDVSNSMLCEDIQPSRLQRAKQAISKLIDKLDNDRLKQSSKLHRHISGNELIIRNKSNLVVSDNALNAFSIIILIFIIAQVCNYITFINLLANTNSDDLYLTLVSKGMNIADYLQVSQNL